jgi:hypothetical protein
MRCRTCSPVLSRRWQMCQRTTATILVIGLNVRRFLRLLFTFGGKALQKVTELLQFVLKEAALFGNLAECSTENERGQPVRRTFSPKKFEVNVRRSFQNPAAFHNNWIFSCTKGDTGFHQLRWRSRSRSNSTRAASGWVEH